MKTYTIPVMWAVTSTVQVEASSLDEAICLAEKNAAQYSQPTKEELETAMFLSVPMKDKPLYIETLYNS